MHHCLADTTLIQTAPLEFVVTYNKYFHPVDGAPGCTKDTPTVGVCGTGFAMKVAVATASASGGSFRVKPEFPATQASPNTRTYATLLLDDTGGALPEGTRFLRLVVDSPGPLGAVAAPLEW